jgi:peptidoglycan/LPS O-acetylase OafA/YrhL
MDTINTILYTLHVLSVLAILVLLLLQWNKNPRKLNPGILHAGLAALIAGLALVGIFESVHPDETLNQTKVGIKLLILIVILIIGYRNLKKSVLSKNTWLALIGLTVTNILIASLW